jgi:ABC-2 type transport system permease protein
VRHLGNIIRLGVKELWSLARDPMLMALIVYTFTAAIYIAATAAPDVLRSAPIAIVDEDSSPLSSRIAAAFYRPRFTPPAQIEIADIDPAMDAGRYTFVLDIPLHFQRDVLAGRSPTLQLNVDATRMTQALTGSGNVQQMVLGEINELVQRYRGSAASPVDLALRMRFNPNLEPSWFAALVELINQVTLLSFILAGAAVIREREHGTIEHLLAMPVTPAEIMLAKIWSMGLAVIVAAGVALVFVVQGVLRIPIEGSVGLFMFGVALDVIATTALGIVMATLARSMPQFAMLTMLILMPLQLLSGGVTPLESMPRFIQDLMLVAPSRHFVAIGQAILFRGAGLTVVWPQLLALAAIAAACFAIALRRFRATIGLMST